MNRCFHFGSMLLDHWSLKRYLSIRIDVLFQIWYKSVVRSRVKGIFNTSSLWGKLHTLCKDLHSIQLFTIFIVSIREGNNDYTIWIFSSNVKQSVFYLLLLVDVCQRSHLMRLMGPEHFTQGTCGNLTGETVDVHLLPLMVRTGHLSSRWRRREGAAEREREETPSNTCTFTSYLCLLSLLTSAPCWGCCWLPVCRRRWCSPPAGSAGGHRLRGDPAPPRVCRTDSGNARCSRAWWCEPGTTTAGEKENTSKY